MEENEIRLNNQELRISNVVHNLNKLDLNNY
jgi:hypothetical protein